MAFLKACAPPRRAALLDELERAVGAPAGTSGFEPLSRAQVADLAARGHEVGSHSVNHALLPQLGDAELGEELARSRATLRGWLGADVPGFCYPNGDHDERVARAVQAAGYRYACTTVPGLQRPRSDRWRVPRIDVSPERVSDHARRYDPVAFRAEVCAFRELYR
jgi:peptidoglycan/xylan/chitin deacetylase (PgdA/CDA1 family)